MLRWTLIWVLAASAWGAPDGSLRRYCFACHNDKLKSGGLSLDGAAPEQAASRPEVWEKVARRLRSRQMPPVGVPRPDEEGYRALLSTIEGALDAAPRDPGRTGTFRRLTRAEYQNAVRDLLALEVDVTSLLPGDDMSHGFDNITTNSLSPTLLEKYLAAARKISRLAAGSAPRGPGGDTFHLPPDLTQEKHFDELPLGTRGGTAMRYTFPTDGEYEFQVRLQRDRNEHVEGLREAHDLELLLDGSVVKQFTVRPPRGGEDHSVVDRDVKVRTTVKAGPHWVAATFPRRSDALLETERQPYEAHFNMDRHPRITPAVLALSIHGPFRVDGPGDTPSRRRIFVCREPSDACAERVLGGLARRAYRRPVQPADLAGPMKFYREARTEGWEAGIEMGLRAILVSPEFLFRMEMDPASAGIYRISDLELASRLSFFLWSSIPDEELLRAAESGALNRDGELERQVSRMLADPKSAALTENFAAQWLGLRSLAAASPDMRLFAGFDDNLRRAFRRETEMFFASMLKEDRPAAHLLRADYTFLNERLAKHYGIAGVYGSRFRRVMLPAGSQRGGLLRQGSILTVTSYANRTSPVLRGKWVLENILGTPPPPPPAGVPALKESGTGAGAQTMRERLAEHRKNPACAGCHKLMDPAGFALENFDAVGRWRTQENGKPVDVSGDLPDGSRFAGVAGLEDALLKRPELFAAALVEKLMTYALGRGIEPADGPAVRQIVRATERRDYRLIDLIQGVVKSDPFQKRRTM